jgi:hypothetical protein
MKSLFIKKRRSHERRIKGCGEFEGAALEILRNHFKEFQQAEAKIDYGYALWDSVI